MNLLRTIFRHGLLPNMLALWGVQFFRKAVPLITVPYLARTLGPAGWGTVAFVQGFAGCVILFVEFGFSLSGTREVARHRDSIEKRAEVFSGVLGAQAFLGLGGVVAALIAQRWIPEFQQHPELMWAGMFQALAEGINPAWYLQGLERMGAVAALEVFCKVAALIGIIVLVRSAQDAWIVLTVFGVASLLAAIAALFLVYREIPCCVPRWPAVSGALRAGWGMFLFRSAESLYTSANAFVLGLFAAPEFVGYYAGAEKISKAFFGFLNPVRDAIYPRLSNLVKHSQAEATHLARAGAALMGAGGLAIGACVFVSAPWLSRLLLGGQFTPAVDVLRVLAGLPPLMAITHSVGLQWLLPLGRDNAVIRIILCAGILNLILAVCLAPRYLHIGMAWAVLTAEASVCISMAAVVALDPASYLSPAGAWLRAVHGRVRAL